jgi:hypothetical protein
MVGEWYSVNRWALLDHPSHLWELEELRNGEAQMIFIHLNVRIWSKSVLRRLLAEFATLRSLIDVPIFATGPESQDEKFKRFVSLFGFKPLINGDFQIFVSYKDNTNG